MVMPRRLSLPGPLKPLLRWGYSRTLTSLGMRHLAGRQRLDPSRPTAVVVSHEASATGAPILALNLCQELSASHNVIVLLLRGGPLLAEFQATATAVVLARRSFVNRKLIHRALAQASGGQPIGFALVNSVVSAPVLEPLRSEGIACLCLVHEFVTYIKPLTIFAEVGLWASRVICSTRLTWGDVLHHCSHLADVPVAYLPQGPCRLPEHQAGTAKRHATPALPPERDAEHVLRNLRDDTLLVLGAGAVQPRKGVDLFIAAAHQIRLQAPELQVRFAWIGSGYAPDHDFSVSVWLNDQITRSGLEDHLLMLDESPAYAALVERSDLFLVSSRLDPLPNVAVDAMLAGTPVLCFADACGFAELLAQHPDLHDSCVAPYFDCPAMARKAVSLLRSPQRLQQIRALTLERARQWFQMPGYVRQLLDLAKASSAEVSQEDADIQQLLAQQLLDRGFCGTDPRLSELALTQRYLLSWRSMIHARKPFPGFHPGIYREQQLPQGSRRDPLAHWHEQGQPQGPWLVPVIQPQARPAALIPQPVALHIHVFYPELLSPILERLSHNQLQADLFLSFSNPELEPAIRQALQQHGRQASLHPVPNRGRDIGPLLSELGQELDRRYAIHGHLHTKKSVLIAGDTAARWREFLLVNLLGDAERPMADQIVAALQADPNLGLVFPDDPGCLGWTENRPHADALAARLGLPPLPQAINFPVGTMFWARQGALRSLYELNLGWDDYPDEPLGYDGTLLHAIERLLPQVCLASGHGYAVTHVPGFSR